MPRAGGETADHLVRRGESAEQRGDPAQRAPEPGLIRCRRRRRVRCAGAVSIREGRSDTEATRTRTRRSARSTGFAAGVARCRWPLELPLRRTFITVSQEVGREGVAGFTGHSGPHVHEIANCLRISFSRPLERAPLMQANFRAYERVEFHTPLKKCVVLAENTI